MNLKKVSDYLDQYINQWVFFGVICVVNDGKIILQKEAGFSCVEFNVRNTLDTCFTLGSNSKQFTAFSIMQLVDSGKAALHVSANQYLPDGLKIDPRITIHHLLSHTSGLHNCYNFDDDFFISYNRMPYNQKDFFDSFINRELLSIPGAEYSYNNANYNILAWIVENISGQSFDRYLMDNIFLPLAMTNSCLDTGTNIIKNKAYPYDFDRGNTVRCVYYNEKFSIGAGAVVSNVYDLIKWHNCLQKRELLSAQAYDAFFSINQNSYCYGLERENIHHKNCFSHGGDHFGVMTYTANFFEEDLFVVLLSNAGFGNRRKISNAMFDIMFTGEYAADTQLPTVELSDEEAARYEGVYLDKKIEIRRHHGQWELVRFDGEIHIPLRPVGNHQFARMDCDQFQPYTLKECDDGSFEMWGYKKS